MTAPPTTYTVQARTSSPGRAVVHAGSESIQFDASWGADPSGLPGPAELLASAFSACLLKNLERAGKLLDFQYQSAEIEVTARRQDAPPKFVEITYRMQIVTEEPERRLELVHRNLQNHGTVYNTLATACDVHGTVSSIRTSAA